MNILGINVYHADTSACIVIDGKIIAACEEERFTRIKHFTGFPINSINFCLNKASLKLEEIDFITVNYNFNYNFFERLKFAFSNITSTSLFSKIINLINKKTISNSIQNNYGIDFKDKIVFIPHHISHISSSFLTSGYKDAVGLSIDATGDFSSMEISTYKNNKINVIEKDGKLSEIANDCISGLIHHHEGLSALLASTVNSYDRLQPASMAGYWANWAGDHRMVTIRTSTSSSNSARIEHRTADGAGNPYIVTSSILKASMLGIKNKYKLLPAEDLDGMENVRATKHVPSSLSKAISALENDKVLKSKIGENFCNAFVEIKRDEAVRLQDKNIDEIREYYLPFV